MKIYGDLISGNCLKVKYTADYLKLGYQWVDVDINAGDAKSPEFLAKGPQGQVPLVELDDGRTLAQSNAIIRYLAHGSQLLPEDKFAAAKVDEALFWEQYSHEPYIAVSRFQMLYTGRSASERDDWRVERGEAALDFMDAQLAARTCWCDSGFSIADISLLAYTRVAHEGGFDLTGRENLRRWIANAERELGLSA